jgi:hypothetical protein
MARRADDVLIAALATGSTVAAAAAQAGLSDATVYVRLRNPEFKERIQVLRSQMTWEAVGVLTSTMTAAATKLRALLDNPNARIQLNAARSIIELAFKAGDLAELRAKLEELDRNQKDMLNKQIEHELGRLRGS